MEDYFFRREAYGYFSSKKLYILPWGEDESTMCLYDAAMDKLSVLQIWPKLFTKSQTEKGMEKQYKNDSKCCNN